MITGSAPGKVILTGEHSVVYGFPAVAVPVAGCRAEALIAEDVPESGIMVKAPQLDKTFLIDIDIQKEIYHPVELTVINFFKRFSLKKIEPFTMEIFSKIPIAGGMGSGAAISAAVIRSLSAYLNIPVTDEDIFTQVMEIEKLYHGNPSGIDPKVIIFEKPFYFIKNGVSEELSIKKDYVLVIADSGIRSSTKEVVGWVGKQHKLDPVKYRKIFSEIGKLTDELRLILESEDVDLKKTGNLLNQNHELLQEMGVSTPELDKLRDKLLSAGVYGAKMSGAGWGGVVIGLTDKERLENVRLKLGKAGIEKVIYS